jgi:hypothetical protein
MASRNDDYEAPSRTAQADTPFTTFGFPATGAPTARTMPDFRIVATKAQLPSTDSRIGRYTSP